MNGFFVRRDLDFFHPLKLFDPALYLFGLGGLRAEAIDKGLKLISFFFLVAVGGLQLGAGWREGRDKVIVPNPGGFGLWLEQLIAESTGKIGKGIIPVDRERLAKPAAYGNDRVFAYLRLASKPSKAQDAAVASLEKAGHPVVRITLPNIYNLGQEIFRWEIATAVAGSRAIPASRKRPASWSSS